MLTDQDGLKNLKKSILFTTESTLVNMNLKICFGLEHVLKLCIKNVFFIFCVLFCRIFETYTLKVAFCINSRSFSQSLL